MWDIINTLRIGEMRAAPVCGLATDYCVKFTALDARSLMRDPPSQAFEPGIEAPWTRTLLRAVTGV